MMQSRNARRALQRLSLRLGGAFAVVAAAVLTVTAQTSESRFKLTFDKPATKWTEALPLGNGRIGAMVFGGAPNERFQINESTLWGGPHDYTHPDAHSRVDKVRQQIFAGKIDEAEKLSENLMGKPKLRMPYQPFVMCDCIFRGVPAAPITRRSTGSSMVHGQPRCSSTAAKASSWTALLTELLDDQIQRPLS